MFYALCATAHNATRESIKIMFQISQALSFSDDDFLAVTVLYLLLYRC